MACVRKRRGRWVVDFRDAGGARRWETYRTREEADDALSKRIHGVRAGSYRPARDLPTFRELALEWLGTKRDRRPSSVAQWEAHVHVHILPALGNLRLDQVTVAEVERFRDERRAAELAPQTVNKLLTTVAAIFKFAARRDLTERNPGAVAERLRTSSAELAPDAESSHSSAGRQVRPDEVLAPDEAAKLIAAADAGLYRTLLLTAVLTGARVGELTALAWRDVDLEGRRLAIRRNLSWARTREEGGKPKPRFFEPKTRGSRRTIPLSAELVGALKRWKLACPPGPLALVFPTAEGLPLNRKRIHEHGLLRAIAAAKVKRVTFHSLRHTFASSLIADGAPPPEVAHLLGHSSAQITLAVYSHYFESVKTASVDNLARRIFSASLRGSRAVAGGAED